LKSSSSVLQATAELLLLDTYHVVLPQRVELGSLDGIEDTIAKCILRTYHPVILNDAIPLEIASDGNCFFRALSMGLFGDQNSHDFLRLVTAIEMILHKDFYDESNFECKQLINDSRLFISKYDDALQAVCTLGGSGSGTTSFVEMLHIFGASAALNMPIQSYCPPTIRAEFLTEPYSRVVCGRNVKTSSYSDIIIMWTQCVIPSSSSNFRPNHFVLLKMLTKKHIERVNIENSNELAVTNHASSASFLSSDIAFDNPGATSSPILKDVKIEVTKPTNIKTNPSQFNESEQDQLAHQSAEQLAKGVHKVQNNTGDIENKNVAVEKAVSMLQNCSEPLIRIPNGPKGQRYFIVDNKENMMRRKNGQHSQFYDDCGAWNSAGTATVKSTYLIQGSIHELKQIQIKGGVYLEYSKGEWHPFQSPPDKSKIVVICRAYYKLKRFPDFKRRITWIECFPVEEGVLKAHALIEYTGEFLNKAESHGNAKTTGGEYVRTDPEVLEQIDILRETKKPREIYNRMVADDSANAPRNLQQVRNRKRKNTESVQVNKKRNLADDFQEILTMAQESLFVKEVFVSGGKPPCVIVHLDENISDIRKFCTTGSTSLGIDRTFNLGQSYVTITVYKNLHVLRSATSEHPIFVGPMFLHWDGSSITYQKFLSYLRSHIDNEVDTAVRYNDALTIGTDDEKALVKALQICFPSANHLLCMIHLQDNTRHLLCDKLGVNKQKREQIIHDVFRVLPEANDSVLFSRQADEIEEKYESELPIFVEYFNNRLRPAIEKHVNSRNKKTTVCWTNNNCESMNHIIKLTCNWTPQQLPELVRKLESVVQAQMQEVRRAVHGQGDFVLAPNYNKFRVQDMEWKCMTSEQKSDHLKRLYRYTPKGTHKTETVTSADGKLTVPNGQKVAKKPGQVTTPRNARTTKKLWH
jgi:hypothetical protein